ncbi:hypothetical protein KACHI17_04750 [Sediminibacterium sp. KACHI17]|uniref:Uncharacterized protein n=1 Tax=Sediminibacterium sp. KACHI17 TaxID=1751071 RepID=A0AAT9GG47_9BACT
MAVTYEIKETYTSGSGDLVLKLQVGNGQYHNTMVMLGDELLVWGTFPKLTIGKVADCKNKKLFIEVNATDTNANTNLIPVTIELADNSKKEVYEYEQSVAQNGGSILFNIYIDIV